jgi:hypothetical protein
MQAFTIFILVFKLYVALHRFPVNSTVSWYTAAFTYASFLESRTAAQIFFNVRFFYSKYGRSNVFDCGQKLSGRHRLALRWLWILDFVGQC